jgi:hypothetical protein
MPQPQRLLTRQLNDQLHPLGKVVFYHNECPL